MKTNIKLINELDKAGIINRLRDNNVEVKNQQEEIDIGDILQYSIADALVILEHACLQDSKELRIVFAIWCGKQVEPIADGSCSFREALGACEQAYKGDITHKELFEIMHEFKMTTVDSPNKAYQYADNVVVAASEEILGYDDGNSGCSPGAYQSFVEASVQQWIEQWEQRQCCREFPEAIFFRRPAEELYRDICNGQARKKLSNLLVEVNELLEVE